MLRSLRSSVDGGVAVVGGLVFLTHMAVSWRHGFFRDELYFIGCGRHPAFGYVDQPPIAPLVAAATQAFGSCLPLLRAVPALAHSASVFVGGALAQAVAREAGLSGRFASVAAAAALALSPMMLGLHTTFGTTTFEVLAWTSIAYLLTRAVAAQKTGAGVDRWLIAIGIVAGVDLETKYSVPFFLAPLLVTLAVGPARKILLGRGALLGAAAAIAIALPSAIWQYAHGLPFLELMHAASHGKNTVIPPLPFLWNQLQVMNVALAPMWVGGVAWALVSPRLARLRFLPVAFLAVLVAMILMHGKDYYVAPAYGVAFALGGAAMERFVPWTLARAAYAVPVAAIAAVGAPLAMPILSPASLARYMRAIGAAPQEQENSQKGEVIPQDQADMLGWPDLEAAVATVWRGLTPAERAHTVILASNYGEAGALDFYGPRDGLPRAVSGHNTYFLWGPGDEAPSTLIRLNGKIEFWKDECDEATIAGRFGANDYVMPYEHDRPILLCRGAKIDLRKVWGEFKSYN